MQPILRMDQETVVASGVPRHAVPLGSEIVSTGRRIPGRAITPPRSSPWHRWGPLRSHELLRIDEPAAPSSTRGSPSFRGTQCSNLPRRRPLTGGPALLPRQETRAPMSLNDLFHLSFRILGWVWHRFLQQAQQHPWAVAAGLCGENKPALTSWDAPTRQDDRHAREEAEIPLVCRGCEAGNRLDANLAGRSNDFFANIDLRGGLKPSRKWVRTLGRTGISRTSHRNSQ